MASHSDRQAQAVAKFRELHADGCFVIPNPWDRGTAVFLEHCGFPALASTSAGAAFALAKPDTVTALDRNTVLEHVRSLAGATSLPLNADFQNGYADDPEELAETVRLCIETGIAGLSIEDATGKPDRPLYDFDEALERVRAARAAIDASGSGVLLTARCEALLVEANDAERVVFERLTAFAEAGADCVFAPGIKDEDTIERLVRIVAPTPVNVLMAAPAKNLTVDRLAELGVRRISVGSALSRVAWGALLRAARSIAETGSFDALADAASFDELDALFRAR